MERGTRQAAADAAEHAGVQLTTYLIEQVYATEPGNKYVRTERALGDLRTYLDPLGAGDFMLTVESAAPYAAQIEQGNELSWFEQQSSDDHVPQVSLDELALLFDGVAEMVGSDFSTLPFFERSGQNYQEPGPHAVPAATAGAYRFADLVEQAWRQAITRAG